VKVYCPNIINDDALGRCLDALYATDVSVLYEILAARVVKKLGMKEAHDNRYLVADAALYASDTLRDLHRQGQRFITRVPLMLSEAKAHVQGLHTQALTALDNGYSGRCVSSTYAGVDWHQYGVSSFALNGSTILAANGATPFAP
jgi:transposase